MHTSLRQLTLSTFNSLLAHNLKRTCLGTLWLNRTILTSVSVWCWWSWRGRVPVECQESRCILRVGRTSILHLINGYQRKRGSGVPYRFGVWYPEHTSSLLADLATPLLSATINTIERWMADPRNLAKVCHHWTLMSIQTFNLTCADGGG